MRDGLTGGDAGGRGAGAAELLGLMARAVADMSCAAVANREKDQAA